MNIQEYRQKFPAYNDMSDQDLADAYFKKYGFDPEFLGKPAENRPMLDRIISMIKEEGPAALRSFAQGTVENLPAIGATGGAMLSALPGVATGPGAPLVVLGGAGAGGLAGKSLQQILGPLVGLTYKGNYPEKESLLPGAPGAEEASNARARSALDMMKAELLGGSAATVIGKMLAPYAGRMTPEASRALSVSRETGTPLSPSSIVPSRPAQILEKSAGGIITGRPVMNAQRQKAVRSINDQIGVLQQKVGIPGEAEAVGQEVKEAIGGEAGAIENFWAKSKDLYENFYKAANVGPTPLVNTDPMRQRMHEILGPELKLPKAQQDAKLVDFINDVLENQPKEMAPKELHEVQKRLYDIGISDRGKVRLLKESIDQAWDEYGKTVQSDVIGALEKARTHFKEGMIELVENPLVKRIIKDESLPGSVQPGAVISQIYRPGNEKIVDNLSKYLPEKTVEDMNARYLANFFDERSAIGRYTVKSVGLDKYIDGDALFKAVQAHKSILDSVFDAKTVRALENLALLSKASMADMRALQNQGMGGLATALNVGGLLGASGSSIASQFGFPGGSKGPLVGVIAGALAAPGIARSLMDPNGILKAWLTEGLMRGPKGAMVRGFAKEGLKVGGRAAMQEKER